VAAQVPASFTIDLRSGYTNAKISVRHQRTKSRTTVISTSNDGHIICNGEAPAATLKEH